jgi:hypothetical protein
MAHIQPPHDRPVKQDPAQNHSAEHEGDVDDKRFGHSRGPHACSCPVNLQSIPVVSFPGSRGGLRHAAVARSSSPRAAGLWGRVARIAKASASFVRSLPKLDGKLVSLHPPGQRWICPRFGDVSQGQTNELSGRFKKWPDILEDLAQLRSPILNRIASSGGG